MKRDNDIGVSVETVLRSFPDILVCLLFGSAAHGRMGPRSDIDIGVAARSPLTPEQRVDLNLELSKACGREVDVVDLQTAPGLLLAEICRHGRVIQDKDPSVYGNIIVRMLDYQTDMMPNIQYIWERRRRRAMA